MDVSFEQLKSMVVFAQIIEQGSFSAAARQLGLSRGVVSYHLKKLETHIGIPLLNRTTRSISLTDAGQRYYQRCKNISDEAAAANQQIENLREEPEGKLIITAPVNISMYTIIPALDTFKKQYPKIEIDLNLTDEIVNIIQEGVDLAIRGAPLADSGLYARKLMTMKNILCGAPSYFSQYGLPHTPAELANHEWVVYKKTSRIQTLSKGSRSYNVRMQGSIATNSASARTAFVLGGHGIGRLPIYDAQPLITSGQLTPILEEYQLSDINIYGVYPPRAANSKKMRLLLAHLQEYLTKLPAALFQTSSATDHQGYEYQ
ncbi:LysR family transcriptional regulator [Photobacterium sp.]|uniref:LysR family transcriptional regulator n=1 Tax=Photobacterium sp. TaxID=660 RepID=UPI00299E0250|nr:LysR family transcriptional regulator [Photobacterium sp.]MDX1304326.1 LysR family transcriptional regulator [Photobacterium sp.]